jgi:hypothetical protein
MRAQIDHQNPTPSMTAIYKRQFTPPFTDARFVRILVAANKRVNGTIGREGMHIVPGRKLKLQRGNVLTRNG